MRVPDLLSSTEFLDDQSPLKKANVKPTPETISTFGTDRPSPFSNVSVRSSSNTSAMSSNTDEATIPSNIRSRLESIGMKTRFSVNRGYGTPHHPGFSSRRSPLEASFQSEEDGRYLGPASTSGLLTERDILARVGSTRSSWSRVKSAPSQNAESQRLELIPFSGSSAQAFDSWIGAQELNVGTHLPRTEEFEVGRGEPSNSSVGALDLKRSREDIFGEFANDSDGDSGDMDDNTMQIDAAVANPAPSGNEKPIKGLPTRRNSPGSGRGAPLSQISEGRANAFATVQTMPEKSNVGVYLANGQSLVEGQEHWNGYNFSSFAKSQDNF